MAKIDSYNAEVIRHEEIFHGHYQTWMKCPYVAQYSVPGNFVTVRNIDWKWPVFLNRPFSIADVDGDIISIIYRVVGPGTQALSENKVGNRIYVFGPCGLGTFHTEEDKSLVLVAGGTGFAALNRIAKESSYAGVDVEMLVGAGSSRLLPEPYIDEWKQLGMEVAVSTDDGSAGHQGRVTDILPETLDNKPDKVLLAGPMPMIEKAAKIAIERGIPGQAATESMMACGIGACLGCPIKVKSNEPEHQDGWKYDRVCTDGPVFDINYLYFD